MSAQQERGANEVNAMHNVAGLAAVPAGAAVPVRELQERYKTAGLSDRELQEQISHYMSIMAYVRAYEGLRERAEPRLRAFEAEMRERHGQEREDGDCPQGLSDVSQASR
jgi:hypothetical protein